ncbi:MAG: extracellular solute-binding protein [Candidatus Enteromonas sp.]|nr:extracellular solute-binding protein [Candidatus Enteromonas sp.]
MKMHSKLFLLAALTAVGLGSCGTTPSSSDKTGDSDSGAPAKKAEVVWWVPCGTDLENNKIYQYITDVADAYNASQESVHVSIVSKGSRNNDYGGTASAVSDALTAGNTPSMVTTYGTYVAAWRKAAPKAVVDVTEYGKTLEADADFNQSYLVAEKQQYDGNSYYSLPYSKSGESLQYNKEVFAAVGAVAAGNAIKNGYPAPTSIASKKAYSVPTSFPEMMELARQMKVDYPSIEWGRGADKHYKAVPVIYESTMNLFVTALESAGIPFMDASKPLAQSVPFIDSPEAKAVVTQLKKWSNEGLIATKNQLAMDGNYTKYPSTVVSEGNSFIMITSTANAAWDAIPGYSVGFDRVPKWTDSSAFRTLSQGPSIAFFNHNNQAEIDGALDFYKFLTSKENTAKLALDTAYFPCRQSSLEVAEVAQTIQDSNEGVTADSTNEKKTSAYIGDVLKLNTSISEKSEYFMSPVNELSAKVRTAVSGIMDAIFNDVDKTTDAEIASLVDTAFANAKTTIFQ